MGGTSGIAFASFGESFKTGGMMDVVSEGTSQ
jgi:hypothetical protein